MGDAIAERHLLAAVLLRAVRDFGYRGSKDPEEARVAEAAREWIFEGEEDVDHIGAFSTICQLMDLDANRVRAQILSMSPSRVRRIELVTPFAASID
ncbi:MAG: hypothetical protein RBU30_19715 [Polyangia bacterium]|nr:hypothetical protein [Polyangia bacterium]